VRSSVLVGGCRSVLSFDVVCVTGAFYCGRRLLLGRRLGLDSLTAVGRPGIQAFLQMIIGGYFGLDWQRRRLWLALRRSGHGLTHCHSGCGDLVADYFA